MLAALAALGKMGVVAQQSPSSLSTEEGLENQVRLEAIASRLEAIAIRMEAIMLEAIALG